MTEYDDVILPTNVVINVNQNEDESVNFTIINNSFEICLISSLCKDRKNISYLRFFEWNSLAV